VKRFISTGVRKRRSNPAASSAFSNGVNNMLNYKIKSFSIGVIVPISVLFIFNMAYSEKDSSEMIELPEPDKKGNISVEEAIFNRKSIRNYKDTPVKLKELSQVLWAAAGKTVDDITGATRAYPSAGGIYPLNIYIVVFNVEGLQKGIYKYLWQEHQIKLLNKGNFRSSLTDAALGQSAVGNASVSLIITANYSRTGSRYGMRGVKRYVHMDAGHVAENIYLQLEALGLATVAIGAFDDKAVKGVLDINREETPLYIMPIGKPLTY